MNMHYRIKPYADIRLPDNSETLAKIIEEANKDDSPDPVYHVIRQLSAKVVEMQDNLIMSTIQTIGGTTYEEITVDKNKVLDMLRKHTAKKVILHEEGLRRHDSMDIEYSAHCPECNIHIRRVFKNASGRFFWFGPNHAHYCEECGQKLDWSEIHMMEART